MRSCAICLFLIFFVCQGVKSQQTLPAVPVFKQFPIAKTSLRPLSFSADTTISFYKTRITAIPSSFYATSIGFFCKKELQVEKAVNFPIKFRLGSVAYTDKMEGKGTGSLQLH